MPNISIKCPHCGIVIQVASSVGLEKQQLQCPQCSSRGPVADFLPKFSLKVGCAKHQLHFGRQWVGRKSSGNDAEVQITDEARYMSRKHAIVELCCTAAGVSCTFEEHGANPTVLRGIKLVNDDIVFLAPNDCLKMGDKNMYLANEYEC